MAWYWYLIITIGCLILIGSILLFGNKKLKKFAYTIVLGAESLYGKGRGADKFNLVIKKLSELTKGIIPESLLRKATEWAVKRMKVLLQEDIKSEEEDIKSEEEDIKSEEEN